MERLTVPKTVIDEKTTRRPIIDGAKVREHAMEFYWRLDAIEDILGDDYDLARLRELVEADQKEADIKNRALYRLAISTYRPEAQTVMVFEEMAELQKELCKHARGTDNREAIAEEIADVQIMLEQMMELHGCKDAVLCYKRHKLERLAERIKRLKGESDGV